MGRYKHTNEHKALSLSLFRWCAFLYEIEGGKWYWNSNAGERTHTQMGYTNRKTVMTTMNTSRLCISYIFQKQRATRREKIERESSEKIVCKLLDCCRCCISWSFFACLNRSLCSVDFAEVQSLNNWITVSGNNTIRVLSIVYIACCMRHTILYTSLRCSQQHQQYYAAVVERLRHNE